MRTEVPRFVFLLALSLPSEGAAYYFVDADPRHGLWWRLRGRKRGSDSSVLQPCSLINLDSGQVMLNFSLVSQKADFQRMELDENGRVARFESVDNIASAMRIPSFGIAHHFGLPDTMFAVGLHPPYAPDKTCTAEGAQRYTLIDKTTQFYAGVSGAHLLELADHRRRSAVEYDWAAELGPQRLQCREARRARWLRRVRSRSDGLTSMKMLDKGKLTETWAS